MKSRFSKKEFCPLVIRLLIPAFCFEGPINKLYKIIYNFFTYFFAQKSPFMHF